MEQPNSFDLKYVINTLEEIFAYMDTPEVMAAKKRNNDDYTLMMCNKFDDFRDRYYSLFSIILKGDFEEMDNLVTMIKTLALVETGDISIDTAHAHISEKLSEKYIYPQFGGKKNFEKTIKQRHKKNMADRKGM